CTSGETWFAYW
nr:immunoglobulin heavy chain junction region [Mus musculus]